ncbi:LppM family (lipo)protein [Georgenia subflava]|uniref:LppM domain-containing protein n=1 Tax=Georgenia subflava TaxID=1622177 RepID=A0A6N7EJT3_9MICO|nr:hypothetical protein [Georgenia subflava]MPV36805.1 hypothetical protein [Georgenia subflava]
MTVRRLRAVVLLPLLLLLAGCFRMEMAFTINADDTADIHLEMLDKSGSLTREDLDCQSLAAEMDTTGLPTSVDYTVENLEEDGNLGCSFDVIGAPLSEMTSQGLTITEADGVYTFALDGDGSVEASLEQIPDLEVILAVTFPGAVIDAGGGEVEGSTVTWSDPAILADGVTATGEAVGDGAARDGAAGGDAADEDTAGADAAGTSWWWWVLGAILLLAVIAVVVALVARSSRQGRPGEYVAYEDLAGAPGAEPVPGAYGVPGAPGMAAGYGQPVPQTAPGAYGVPGQQVAPGTPGQPTAWAAPDGAGQPGAADTAALPDHRQGTPAGPAGAAAPPEHGDPYAAPTDPDAGPTTPHHGPAPTPDEPAAGSPPR